MRETHCSICKIVSSLRKTLSKPMAREQRRRGKKSIEGRRGKLQTKNPAFAPSLTVASVRAPTPNTRPSAITSSRMLLERPFSVMEFNRRPTLWGTNPACTGPGGKSKPGRLPRPWGVCRVPRLVTEAGALIGRRSAGEVGCWRGRGGCGGRGGVSTTGGV